METFRIMGAKITHTLIDKDYLIRYRDADRDGMVSSQNLKDILDNHGKHLFEKFITRAYRDSDGAICKLRSGIQIEFCLRPPDFK